MTGVTTALLEELLNVKASLFTRVECRIDRVDREVHEVDRLTRRATGRARRGATRRAGVDPA